PPDADEVQESHESAETAEAPREDVDNFFYSGVFGARRSGAPSHRRHPPAASTRPAPLAGSTRLLPPTRQGPCPFSGPVRRRPQGGPIRLVVHKSTQP